MNDKPYAVFPGSFDPYTAAHHELVKEASKFFNVIILICHNPDKPNGMFTTDERYNIIHDVIEQQELHNVTVDTYAGLVTNYCDEKYINYVIRGIQYKNAAEELDLASIYYDDEGLKTIFFPTYTNALKQVSSTRIREYIKNYSQLWEFFVPVTSIPTIRSYIENKRKLLRKS